MTISQDKVQKTFEALKGDFGYKNTMSAPKVEKVVISTGTGKIKDKGKIEVIQDRLARITGQKTAARPAKKSIASFKLREGDIVGYQTTLRGEQMYSFLDKLIHVALPRTRDFRGIKTTAIDEMGNLTIGVKEHTIFPEAADEDLKDVFGFAITIVSTAKNKEEAKAFFTHLGIPFKKEESK
ncbi:MAG: 50S ribosomal protein L5 [Patescibacteria group bacterium UBA2103]